MIKQSTRTQAGRIRKLKSILGELPVSEKQAFKLQVESHQRISPYLTECCLRASANLSYDNAARDVERYTGMKVSPKTQQRLVHRHRLINYDYFQAEGICAIASGAVESTVKQIDRRLKISGAQWNSKNIPQVLKHRCAYLNDTLLV